MSTYNNHFRFNHFCSIGPMNVHNNFVKGFLMIQHVESRGFVVWDKYNVLMSKKNYINIWI